MEQKYKQPEISQEEKQAKVYQLNVELADVAAKKKSMMGGFNDELKRLKAEIKDLISPDQETFEVV